MEPLRRGQIRYTCNTTPKFPFIILQKPNAVGIVKACKLHNQEKYASEDDMKITDTWYAELWNAFFLSKKNIDSTVVETIKDKNIVDELINNIIFKSDLTKLNAQELKWRKNESIPTNLLAIKALKNVAAIK